MKWASGYLGYEISLTYFIVSIFLPCLINLVMRLCSFAESPVSLRGKIFPDSVTKRDNGSTSLKSKSIGFLERFKLGTFLDILS